MQRPRPIVIFGVPTSERVKGFQAALHHLGRPAATVISYRDAIDAPPAPLAAHIPHGAWVRLDSPGDDWPTERALVAYGATVPGDGDHEAATASISAEMARNAVEDRGRIFFPHQWYRGFMRLLHEIGSAVGRVPGAQLSADPGEIAAMFDKRACHAHLARHSIPVPPALSADVRSFAELLDAMTAAKMPRVFVKLAHGSSASGVVALQIGQEKFFATTTAELVRDKAGVTLYNNKNIRRYRDRADIAAVIDELAAHRIHVEAWIPKAAVGDEVFDLRILAIAGDPQHVVARMSRTPVTNLHVGHGNHRGDLDAVRRAAGESAWQAMLEIARHVARAFPNTHCMGIDLAFTPRFKTCYVLEVNAFGDWLKRTTHHGRDPWEAQIAALDATQ